MPTNLHRRPDGRIEHVTARVEPLEQRNTGVDGCAEALVTSR